MPFCPDCGHEYQDYITECFDCGADLVETFRPASEAASDIEWIKLQKFSGTVFAEMTQNVLKENDIPCLIQKSFFSSALGGTSTGLGGYDSVILVPKGCLAEAEEIVRGMLDAGC